MPEDFSSTGRALELFRQAVACGLMPNDSEHSRLLWMAAVERARTAHDAKNPAGVFLFLVKSRRWDFLSDGHFDGANRRLKAYLHAPPAGADPAPAPAGRVGPGPGPRLSRDALLVRVVRDELARKGFRGDVFAALRAHAGWDRGRFERAVAELEGQAPAIAAAR